MEESVVACDTLMSGTKDSQSSTESLSDICLFVANLPSSFSDEELEHHLRSLLSRFGAIHSTKAARDKKLRPFCFVQFRGLVQPEVFSQPHYLGGRSLRLEKSRVRSNDLSSTATTGPSIEQQSANFSVSKWSYPMVQAPPLFILSVMGFSPVEGNRRSIFHRFKQYGYVLGVDLQWIAASSKIAYIYYDNAEAVQAAIRENDGLECLGGKLRCEVIDQNEFGFSTTSYHNHNHQQSAYYNGWYGMSSTPHTYAAQYDHPPQQQGNYSFGHRF